MKKIRLLYAATIISAFASFCLILLCISCSKEQSVTRPIQTFTGSIFTNVNVSGTTKNDSTGGVVLGMRFRTSVAGKIVGIRFYKTLGNTGAHSGQLYSSDGTLLASAEFIKETDSGWQTVNFTQPVEIAANTTYVAAYFSASGNYTYIGNYFSADIENSPLKALADGADGFNGIFIYSSLPAFPSEHSLVDGGKTNYWVDVVESYQSGG